MAMTIYGPHYSTYVRTVRLVLEEQGAPYELVEVDIFSGQQKQPAHTARHPFGKVPAFEHDGKTLYEAAVITRYLDQVLADGAYTPQDPWARARMNQAIAVIDQYAYQALVTTITIQRLIVPSQGGQPDEVAIEAALPIAGTSLAEIASVLGQNEMFGGDRPCLADFHVAPVMAYITQTPEAEKLLGHRSNLRAWYERFAERESMKKTAAG